MAASPEQPPLNAEQSRALKILADAGQDGLTEVTLFAYGFLREMLAELVLTKHATVKAETIGPAIKVERYRVTAAGRRAIAAE